MTLPLPVPKRKSRETGEQGWRGKESKEKGRGVVEKGRGAEERLGKRKETGPRLEKSGRGNRLVERALRERN